LFWILHIIIYVLPVMLNQLPLGSFLNSFFESTFSIPLIGIVFYGIFAFWLLACVIKGNVKMGVRFVFVAIHEMK
jgi:LMBR1 domain-containing protein 1